MKYRIWPLIVALALLLGGLGTVAAAGESDPPFVADESIIGDPPEGQLALHDAQRVLNRLLQEWDMAGNAPTEVYRYLGIVEIDGRECYEIALEGAPDGDRDFAVGGYGEIYLKYEDGEYVMIMPAVPEIVLQGKPAAEVPFSGPALVGTLPKDAIILQNVADDLGNYYEELLTDDGAIVITTLRQVVDDFYPAEMPAEDFVRQYFRLSEMRDVELLSSEPVASYPTERMRFITGAEEETSVTDLLLIRTDAYTFVFSAKTTVDIYEGMIDGHDAGDVPELIGFWIESLDLFEA